MTGWNLPFDTVLLTSLEAKHMCIEPARKLHTTAYAEETW